MHDRLHRSSINAVVVCSALLVIVAFSTNTGADERRDTVRTLQSVIDELRAELALPVEVTASVVPSNTLLVSVQPVSGRMSFEMSFQQSFLDGLDADEIRTIVAHELGHVWIFTHHPYLQTEVGANDVALRLVTRESLERVYGKVWAHQGVKGSLGRFVRNPE